SARIGYDVDHGRAAGLHGGDGASQRRRQIFWIGDRPLAVRTHAAGDGGVIDIRVLDRGADVHLVDAAAMSRRHGDEIHVFLMVGAVVVDDVEDRNLVVRRGPQRPWIEHEVAVAAERQGETAVLLVGERR